MLVFGIGRAQFTGGQTMSDEQAIRELFNNWVKATTEGNLELARQCITDDAVFFVPGAGKMDKETFAQAAAGGSPEDFPIAYDLDCKMREVKVFGDQAYLWIESVLICSPKNGDPSTKMAGHSLSVLEKRDGRWQIIRDANTLTVVPE
jgi:uncharacterized protein (TIGR02246 family)